MEHGTIGILTGKGPAGDALSDWLDLLPSHIKRHRIPGNQIAWQRNQVIRAREGAWVLMCDADSVPSHRALELLLESGFPLISGTVLERGYPFEVCAVKNLEPYERWRAEDLPGEPFPVPSVGTGFLLIREAVIEKLGDPWFRCGQIHPELLAEDMDFSLRAAALGFPPYLHPNVRIGHETKVILWPDASGIMAQWPDAEGWTRHRSYLDPLGEGLTIR